MQLTVLPDPKPAKANKKIVNEEIKVPFEIWKTSNGFSARHLFTDAVSHHNSSEEECIRLLVLSIESEFRNRARWPVSRSV